jgi:hypothetical protein
MLSLSDLLCLRQLRKRKRDRTNSWYSFQPSKLCHLKEIWYCISPDIKRGYDTGLRSSIKWLQLIVISMSQSQLS